MGEFPVSLYFSLGSQEKSSVRSESSEFSLHLIVGWDFDFSWEVLMCCYIQESCNLCVLL